ncbi:hypothetical protein IF2G_09724 [Cordyceps javanica]|nr:hypothetical protein IF2G_09724 [Cordyceps javanica]
MAVFCASLLWDRGRFPPTLLCCVTHQHRARSRQKGGKKEKKKKERKKFVLPLYRPSTIRITSRLQGCHMFRSVDGLEQCSCIVPPPDPSCTSTIASYPAALVL